MYGSMRTALIHAPGGGSASDADHERAAVRLGELGDLTVYVVGRDGDPDVLARRALDAGSTLVVAQGGDGTTSAVASALVNVDGVALAMLPAGTANSIAGFFEIPKDVDAACDVIAAGHERVIDTAVANGRAMVLLAAIGLHAEAIVQADPDRKRELGLFAYVIEGIQRAGASEPFEIELWADGQQQVAKVSGLTIANLAPRSSVFARGPSHLIADDGLLDVTLVRFEGLAEAAVTTLHLATSALAGADAEGDNVGWFRARHIRVRPRVPQALMIDGEDAGRGELEVICVPRSLRVRVPLPPPEIPQLP